MRVRMKQLQLTIAPRTASWSAALVSARQAVPIPTRELMSILLQWTLRK